MDYKNIVFDIVGVLFDYNLFFQRKFEPIDAGIDILTAVSKQKKFNIFACTNMSDKNFSVLKSEYAEYISLFHGIVTSERAMAAKPSKEIFYYLCKTYKIDPKETVYLDDTQENVRVAVSLGMHSLHVRDFTQLQQELEELGFDFLKKG